MATTQLPLELLASEQLTVSSSAVGITAAKLKATTGDTQPLDIIKAFFHHDGGGKIYHAETWPARGDVAAVSDPSNTGANGEIPQQPGDKWAVSGLEAVTEWKAIKNDGSSDATIAIQIYGRRFYNS
jgi:hypothetical protein